MASSLRSIKSLNFFYLSLILTILPLPVSPLPLAMIITRDVPDENTPTSGSTRIDDKVIFDIVFALTLFLALIGALSWLASRMTTDRFLGGMDRLLATPIALAEQLPYLSVTTLLSVIARTVVDTSDDVNDASTRRRGGLSNPMSTVSRVRSQIRRFGRAASAQDGAIPDPVGSA